LAVASEWRYSVGVRTGQPMTFRLALALSLAGGLLMLGCESCGSVPPRALAESEHPSAPTHEAPAEAPPADPPPLSDPPPPVRELAPALTLSTSRTASAVVLTIANRTTEPVSFASHLVLERVADGQGEAQTDRGELLARLDAERTLPECTSLVAGALLELSFENLAGPGCTRCEAPEPGDYRFVITSCDGSARTEGPILTIAP